MIWKEITDISELDGLGTESNEKSVLIFKHSTRCSISTVAKKRMESHEDEIETWASIYLLNLIENRAVSNLIAEKYSVQHESPQVLLIEKDVCVYHKSHLAILPKEIKSYSGF
jgi:bacillithiol system protein YtxJ